MKKIILNLFAKVTSMKKELDYLAMNKTADERNLEAKGEIKRLKELLEQATTVSNYLRNNMDDVLLPNQTKTLFDLTKTLSTFQKNLQ